MNWKLISFAVAYPIVTAGVAGYWASAKLRDELASRPPVAIIDEEAYVAANLKSGATTQDLEQLLVRSEGVAKQLSDHGYVVFRKQQVFSAPAELEAKP
ncbi:hypothetical protein H8Z72_22865 (plasmid) [Xanthomonas citri pv. citri]|uniref:hypothetical protein n=1 Tax=Xanthomonas citri TaxID=346 RepID=UPI0019316549|nr:hypothetical protein [Xanthomonas citri]QRD62627.1 hypothetical protein H8Z74_23320 [Xanthomonas citri pv. citri]QRD67162.1 hypothetical protein H8Z73_22300 [Xanthomonas citri pv. citri]QRD71793.1 hypothetical protein H8Z72_22865 [Xanthomonas citri pv. citri]